jgi:mRNA deadenylase 3'-5' endonuclease subunit Ccr4
MSFSYRRLILMHEIKNYNADVIFLQECEIEFYNDLVSLLADDYAPYFKIKTKHSREGEAIFIRSSRFK